MASTRPSIARADGHCTRGRVQRDFGTLRRHRGWGGEAVELSAIGKIFQDFRLEHRSRAFQKKGEVRRGSRASRPYAALEADVHSEVTRAPSKEAPGKCVV